jgi:hypothetical protein
MAASDIVKNNLHRLKTQFYPSNEKGFFQQRSMLIKGITHPASYLKERGVRLPNDEIQAILDKIIRGIMHHGNTGKIGFFCAYFLKSVQDHMKIQGDTYYEKGKSLRRITETALEDLTKKQAARLGDARDRTTDELAALNQLVRSTTLKHRKKTVRSGTQLDLF